MTPAQTRGLEAVARRLRRVDDTLRARVVEEQRQRDELKSQLDACRDQLAQQDDALMRLTAHIDRLVSGTRPLRIDDLLGWQEQQSVAQTRRGEAVTALTQADDALRRGEAKVAGTRTAIMRNDERIRQCDARLAQLRAQSEREEADRQDEEAEEALGARRLAQRTEQAQVGRRAVSTKEHR